MANPQGPRLPAGERLRRAGIGAWSIIGLLILAYIAVWALLKIRIIFPPLVLALLIIYVLNPVVGRLQRRGVPRAVGAVGSYVVIFGALTLLVIALIPVVSAQVSEFEDQLPRFRRQVVSFVDDAALALENSIGVEVDTTQIDCLLGSAQAPSTAECDSVTQQLREDITSQAGRLTELGFSVLETLLAFILAPLIALYLLIDLPSLRRDLVSLVPPRHRDEVVDVASKVGRAVGGFFRGQLLVALIVGVLSSIGFYVIDLPFWLVIGSVAGFFNLVPLIGPYIGGGLGFLVGLISGSLALGIKAALVELVVQQVDNHVISPNVMKRTVNVHPVTVMLALLAGGALAGFWGVLLGVPAVAVGKIVLGHVWATRVLGVATSTAPTPAVGQAPSPLPDERAPEVLDEPRPQDEDDAATRETAEEHAEPYPVPDRHP